MDLNEITIFVKVAQLGSFSKAAQSLNIPKSTVSTKLSNLENRLGISLMHRTTRKINLTQIGDQFFKRCLSSIDNLKSAEDEVVFNKGEPQGKLTVTAPVFLGNSFFPEVLQKY